MRCSTGWPPSRAAAAESGLIRGSRTDFRDSPFNYGARAPEITHGSNHIRYLHTSQTRRLNTNAPITYVLDETPFLLEEPVSFLLGPDETLAGGVEETARELEEETAAYWRRWTRRLALPFEWQEAVTRAAITLKLCAFEETGAIIAAMTTSIPEAAGTGRNWDYRYCWLRDSFFVVRALNSMTRSRAIDLGGTHIRFRSPPSADSRASMYFLRSLSRTTGGNQPAFTNTRVASALSLAPEQRFWHTDRPARTTAIPAGPPAAGVGADASTIESTGDQTPSRGVKLKKMTCRP